MYNIDLKNYTITEQRTMIDMMLGDMLIIIEDNQVQASIRCLAQNGRFLEIGKVDLSQNSPLGMAVFLKNITFHGILLDAVMDPSVGKKEDWQVCVRMIEKFFLKQVIERSYNL